MEPNKPCIDQSGDLMQVARQYEYILRVATMFRKQGFSTYIPLLSGVPETDKNPNIPDVVVKNEAGKEVKIKVIPIEAEFFQKEKFPDMVVTLFPKDSWDHADPKPNLIVLMSKVTKGIIIVPYSATFDKWTVEEKIDTRSFSFQPTYGVLVDETINFTECIRRLRRGANF